MGIDDQQPPQGRTPFRSGTRWNSRHIRKHATEYSGNMARRKSVSFANTFRALRIHTSRPNKTSRAPSSPYLTVCTKRSRTNRRSCHQAQRREPRRSTKRGIPLKSTSNCWVNRLQPSSLQEARCILQTIHMLSDAASYIGYQLRYYTKTTTNTI
jgi:hypothetical protein